MEREKELRWWKKSDASHGVEKEVKLREEEEEEEEEKKEGGEAGSV